MACSHSALGNCRKTTHADSRRSARQRRMPAFVAIDIFLRNTGSANLAVSPSMCLRLTTGSASAAAVRSAILSETPGAAMRAFVIFDCRCRFPGSAQNACSRARMRARVSAECGARAVTAEPRRMFHAKLPQTPRMLLIGGISGEQVNILDRDN